MPDYVDYDDDGGYGVEAVFTPAKSMDYVAFRCPPARTVAMEKAIREHGFPVFTPQHWISKRLPRKRKRVWQLRAVLPSFLFLSIKDRPGLAVELTRKQYGAFTGLRPMTIQGRLATFSQEEFDRMWEWDNRENRPASPKAQKFKPGDLVKVASDLADGAMTELLVALFEGSTGVAEKVNRDGEVLVAIKNSTGKVWVSGFFLELVAI